MGNDEIEIYSGPHFRYYLNEIGEVVEAKIDVGIANFEYRYRIEKKKRDI